MAPTASHPRLLKLLQFVDEGTYPAKLLSEGLLGVLSKC